MKLVGRKQDACPCARAYVQFADHTLKTAIYLNSKALPEILEISTGS
jgi:hypothetical protein